MLYLLLLFILSPILSVAQNFKMEVVVISKQTTHPIPYAIIEVKNRNTGVVCDENGKALLEIHIHDTLTFSSIGYADTTIYVSSAFNLDKIILRERENTLPEIVIKNINYSGFKKETKSGIWSNRTNHTLSNQKG